MARIRTIKPDFYRHEVLQEIEIENPGCYVMLVYSALWGHCDKHGLFEWKPRQMQLDIIPFIWEATGKRLRSTLEVLVNNGFITVYTDGKKYYGHIESFTDHQRIQGKESQAPSPLPNVEGLQLVDISEVQEKHRGSNGEAPENRQRIQEGKGREGNKEEEKEGNNILSVLPAKQTLPYESILDQMNSILGTRFRLVDSFRKIVRARLNEGMQVEDFSEVCQKMKSEWGSNPDMVQYLRPETLFGNKMNGYLGRVGPGKKMVSTGNQRLFEEIQEMERCEYAQP